MNKIGLIFRREYVTRVRNKTFLLSTFLLPVMMILFIAGSVYFASKSAEQEKKIAVKDVTGFLPKYLKSDSGGMIFVFLPNDKDYEENTYDGLLYNSDTASRQFLLKTKKAASLATIEKLKGRLSDAIVSSRLLEKDFTREKLDSIYHTANAYYSILNKDEKNENVNSGANTSIGFACGILIYITMFIFGAMVMRGVMEEKTNRIAEVMVSSVRPFQLMMGKILGIGAVGLTQLLLWIILIFGISLAASLFLPSELIAQVQQLHTNPTMMNSNTAQYSEVAKSISTLGSLPWFTIISCFLFYFLGGYLFYSALFAAVGSVINEDPQEAQSLMLPIMMPIVFGFIIMSGNLNTPDSNAMVWGSIIPFTSPIVMMGRIASNPPLWQLALSMVMLVAGFLFTTWLAGKIYRTGILMYGKKASWKEMIKWAFRKS